MDIVRVPTGIHGLDEHIEGGLIKDSVNLLAGASGTGKTIFGCQFLLEGLRNGENGVYVTLEQRKEDIMSDMSRFGWHSEFDKYIKEGKFLILTGYPGNMKKLADFCTDAIEKIGAKRFVLDSLTIAAMGLGESNDLSILRRGVFDFMLQLKKMRVTSILLTEIPEDKSKSISKFGFEEFLADGIILLHYLEYAAGGTPRNLIIRKMRRTAHDSDVLPIEIGKDGIQVLPLNKGLVL